MKITSIYCQPVTPVFNYSNSSRNVCIAMLLRFTFYLCSKYSTCVLHTVNELTCDRSLARAREPQPQLLCLLVLVEM